MRLILHRRLLIGSCPLPNADMARIEIPQCTLPGAYRWLCYLLGEAQRGAVPASIQHDSGLAQGLAGACVAG